jgi:hypothetical protein
MMQSRISPSTATRLLADPACFLHSVDLDGDRAVFFRIDRALLREASFVDGRSSIALDTPETVLLSDLAMVAATEPRLDRYIFNQSFCGSTLLARLLDVPGQSLVLKEPNCLVDLSVWKTLNLRAGRPLDRLAPALRLVRQALRRPFAPSEVIVVKPAGWANILIDELVADAARIRPLFMTIDRRSFLRAVFRRGTDRMTHAAQRAWHMASAAPDGDALLQAAAGAASDPNAKAANLALVAHHLQLASFRRAMVRGGWGADHIVDFRLISEAPLEAAHKAARALKLALDASDIERNVDHFARKHAKKPAMDFSASHQEALDKEIAASHGPALTAALAWADAALGPETALGVPDVQPA